MQRTLALLLASEKGLWGTFCETLVLPSWLLIQVDQGHLL